MGETTKGIIDSGIIGPEEDVLNYRMDVNVTDAIAIAVKEITGNEKPDVQLRITGQEVQIGDTFDADLTMLNTTGGAVSGTLSLQGIPKNWQAALVDGQPSVENLAPGQKAQVHYRVTIAGPVNGGGATFYGQVDTAIAGSTLQVHSIPQYVKATWPIATVITPGFTYMAPSEQRTFAVKVKNTHPSGITGTLRLDAPQGYTVTGGSEAFHLEPNGEQTFTFTVATSVDAAIKDTQFMAVVTYNGLDFSSPIGIHMKSYNPLRSSTEVNLANYYNTDGFSYEANPKDGNNDGSGHSLPADTFPANQRVRYMGVEFLTPDTSDGTKNLVTTQGQTIPVTEGGYASLALLTLATNGSQSGGVVLNYTDGTSQSVNLQVSDWCKSAQFGEEKVIQFPGRNSQTGPTSPACGIYFVSLPVNSAKALSSITLPVNNNLHVVSASLVN